MKSKAKGKPPLLSAEEMKQCGGFNPLIRAYVTPIDIFNIQFNIAQAQREADIKWYEANQSK